MQSRGVRRLSARPPRPSVNFLRKSLYTTTQMARLRPNLHKIVSMWPRIQGVLKVKVKGHVPKSWNELLRHWRSGSVSSVRLLDLVCFSPAA